MDGLLNTLADDLVQLITLLDNIMKENELKNFGCMDRLFFSQMLLNESYMKIQELAELLTSKQIDVTDMANLIDRINSATRRLAKSGQHSRQLLQESERITFKVSVTCCGS